MSDRLGPAENESVDDRPSTQNEIAPRVYRDEPITPAAWQMENFTPPKYREMRKMARGVERPEYDTKLFYEQGRFMEDFEDDFDHRGGFERYFPTYQSMNDRQLREYFSWRTRLRRGLVEKTSLSFAFVYIYELLNRIGVPTPVAGLHTLKDFWAAYGKIDARIDPYLRLWTKDYVVYNDLDKSLFEDRVRANFDRTVLKLLDFQSLGPEGVFEELNSLSPYDLANSRFFKRHPEDVKRVVYNVFSALWNHYEKRYKTSVCEKLFGRVLVSSYPMFHSAVFCHRDDRENFVYEIDDIYRYICQNGHWSCERLFWDKRKIRRIGAWLKAVDFLMRKKYCFSSTLKAPQTTKLHQEIIEKEIDRYLENAKKAALPKIAIDVSKLRDIRRTALETQSKLIVEGMEDAVPPKMDEKTARPDRENDPPLNDVEYRFMGCLLYGRPYDDLVRSRGLMTSLLIDAINEKLFDAFGDTVVIFQEERPILIEDYVEDLKGIVTE